MSHLIEGAPAGECSMRERHCRGHRLAIQLSHHVAGAYGFVHHIVLFLVRIIVCDRHLYRQIGPNAASA